MKRLIAFSIGRPCLLLATAALLSLPAVSALRDLHVDLSLEQFVADRDPLTRRYKELGERFGRADRTLTVLWTDPQLFSNSGATQLRELTETLGALPWVEQVDSLVDSQIARRDPLFDLLYPGRRIGAVKLIPALGSEARSPTEWENLEKQIRGEPLLAGRLLSEDGKTAILLLWLHSDYDDGRDRQPLLQTVSRILEARCRSGRSFLLTGSPPTREAYLQLIRQDAKKVFPLVLIAFTLLLGVTLRHWLGIVVPALVAGSTILWTLALQSALGRPLSPLSIALPVILTFAASSDSIHLFHAYRRALKEGSKKASLASAAERLNGALLLTSATTAAGFLSLVATGIPVLRDFGLVAALGMGVAYTATMTTGLAALSLLPAPTPSAASGVGWIGRLTRRSGTAATAALLFLLLSAAAGMPRLRVESLLVDDVRSGHPIRQTRQAVEERMGGGFPLTFILHTSEDLAGDSLRFSEFAARIREFESTFSQAPDFVSSSISPAAIYRFFWRAMTGLDPLPRAPADWKVLDAVARRHVENAFPDWREGIARIEARVFDRGTARTFEFLEKARTIHDRVFGEDSRLEIQGFVYLAQEMQRRVVGQSARGFALGLLAVGVTLAALLRSRRLVFFAILVNVFPALTVLSLMGLSGIEMRISSCIVFSIILGVCVDDTIHLLAAYRPQGVTGAAGVCGALQEAAPGILSTSLVMAAGFLTLQLADFTPARVTGQLLALSILAALLADLVILPALLLRWGNVPQPSRLSPRISGAAESLSPFPVSPHWQPDLICWDLDGTLYSRRRAALQLCRLCWVQTLRGKPPFAALGELLRLWERRRQAGAKRNAPNTNIEEMTTQPWISPWIDRAIGSAGPRPGVRAVLDYFESIGSVQVVYSDHPVRHKLEALSLGNFFSAVYAGDEIGAVKPDHRMLRKIAAEFGLQPGRVLVIGDRQDTDGETARRAGSAFLLLGRDFPDFEWLHRRLRNGSPPPATPRRAEGRKADA